MASVDYYFPPLRWSRLKLLDSGCYADVYLAGFKNSKHDRFYQLFALKTAKLFQRSSSLEKELRIYNDLKHCPEIITCFREQLTVKGGDLLYNLLLEYAPCGTLSKLIHKYSRNNVNNINDDVSHYSHLETNVQIYTRMILRGLSHIHSKGYVHCDLKPDNILVFPSDQNDTGHQLKIADFGLAKEPGEVIPRDRYKLRRFRGTPIYMSPESVQGRIETTLDIWSLGCVVVEMCTGRRPWQLGVDYEKPKDLMLMLAFSEKSPKVPEYMSKDGRDFLSKCLARDPRNRWSAQMLLDHPYVSESVEQ
ncbi:Serine/threonine protein kinase [Trema orientale]|uniref:Serine/threonine protein kinase n=1 Tax=Trema orientale TaxID=63057 RepID=A0A2P5CKS2_TREOI|nr:Serine/threonine protein kinase [Trema orientale]